MLIAEIEERNKRTMMLNWNEYRDQVNAAVKEISKANPDIVRSYAGLNAANAKSTRIDAKTRELIALAVAVTLRCAATGASMRTPMALSRRGPPRRRSWTRSASPSW